jgi:CheY-like chemotaxis protein
MQTVRDDQTPRTALIVEYDRWERWCTAELLAGQGYLVLGASNGASGLRMAEQNACDVILLAPLLPEMSVSEVLQQLRATDATREIPVIIFSAMAKDKELKALLNLLDRGLMLYRCINGSTFPGADPALVAVTPSVSDPNYTNLHIWGPPTILRSDEYGRAYAALAAAPK